MILKGRHSHRGYHLHEQELEPDSRRTGRRDQSDLREHACDEVQGFYFNKPVSAQQFTDLLQAQSADTTYIGSRAALAKTMR